MYVRTTFVSSASENRVLPRKRKAVTTTVGRVRGASTVCVAADWVDGDEAGGAASVGAASNTAKTAASRRGRSIDVWVGIGPRREGTR
jgi:hypothetical protein